MHDVNFGEAILYHEGKSKLLVDCGAKFDGAGKLAFDSVKDKLDEETELMITHFDSDHFNGICEIDSEHKFKKIYLSNYTYFDDMVKDTLKVWTYLLATNKKNRITSLHKFFMQLKNLVSTIDDIKCVSIGDKIKLDTKTLEILWPPKNPVINYIAYSDRVKSIIEEQACERNPEALSAFFEEADQYVDTLYSLLRFFSKNHIDENQNEENSQYYNYQIFETLDYKFNELTRLSAKIKFIIEGTASSHIDYITRTTIRNMNECSIIFQCNDEIAAFGDATPRIIKYLKINKILSHRKYKLVKVPHHGTRGYWSEDLPTADYYCISNSGSKQKNWTICEKYGMNYNDSVVCTNTYAARCEYYKTTRFCRLCNAASRKKEMSVDLL